MASADNQLTLSLNGTTTNLIQDDTTGVYRAQGDHERVERLTGATNGAQSGEYFRMTTPNCAQYTFGLNRLPGWVRTTAPRRN